jgi:heptosyltransferase III
MLKQATDTRFLGRSPLLPPDDSIKKILIYRTGSLGDMLVTLPILHLIARRFPEAKRVLLTNIPGSVKEADPSTLFAGTGLIQDYLYYPGATRDVGKMLTLTWRIRRLRPDLLVYMPQTRTAQELIRDRRFFRLSGVRRFVGLLSRDELKYRFDSSTGLHESEVARLARVLSEIGDAREDDLDNWDLHLTPSERQTASRALCGLAGKPLIACGPATKMQAKDWGQENWRTLLAELSRRYREYGLVLIGARGDAEISDFAAQDWDGVKVNLCGKLSPRESAAVLEHAHLFLGPDSGPMHLAACVGVRCAIAFSARGLPGMWFPVGKQHQIVYHQTSCYGCNLQTCTSEARRCLTSISVEEMLEAAIKVLDCAGTAHALQKRATSAG